MLDKKLIMRKLPIYHKVSSGGIQFDRNSTKVNQILLPVFIIGLVLIIVSLIIRLFQLTIVKGAYYRRLSDQNRIKELLIEPERGEIKDRKGFAIAKNTPPNIQLNPELVSRDDERIHSRRIYETPEAIAHIIGYQQTADPADFKNDTCPHKLKLGDRIGKKGIELQYECLLRGQYGKKLVEIDAKGKYLETLTVLPPIPGETIQLALDLELQKKAYELIQGKRASVIATNPNTGEILVYVSSPSFSPQVFEDQNSNEITRLLTDNEKPMFNRVASGVFAPGSIFKLVVAAAGLEEKAIDEHTRYEDTGQIQAGPLKFGNWYFLQYGKTEGMVDIVKALQRSNDIYFYKAGEAIGPEKIKKWANIFGYGKKTGLGFGEEEGTIPSPFWKEETLKDRWYTGDTYNYSIGQGYVTTTPLQTVFVTGVFANNGYLCRPMFLKNETPECKKLPLSQKTIEIIKTGMKQACTTGGTGWPLFDFKYIDKKFPIPTLLPNQKESSGSAKLKYQPIQTACKTGTAESHAKSGFPHAWITAYAPYENPEIAISVLVEEGGQGSDIAGPIARDLLKSYFERNE